nr:hypothetical protein CFP56_48833 [Quercus suber]
MQQGTDFPSSCMETPVLTDHLQTRASRSQAIRKSSITAAVISTYTIHDDDDNDDEGVNAARGCFRLKPRKSRLGEGRQGVRLQPDGTSERRYVVSRILMSTSERRDSRQKRTAFHHRSIIITLSTCHARPQDSSRKSDRKPRQQQEEEGRLHRGRYRSCGNRRHRWSGKI